MDEGFWSGKRICGASRLGAYVGFRDFITPKGLYLPKIKQKYMREINQYVAHQAGVSQLWEGVPCWVATAAMLAASAASSIIGGATAKKAAKKAARENAYRTNAEDAWYRREYNTDYIDTKAGQNLLRKAQDIQDKYIKKAQGSAAVTGGTEASVAAAKESANKVMGDTIADIASSDTSRKKQVADKHIDNVRELSQERQVIEQSKAEATSNAAQNMSNALMSAAVTRMGSQPTNAKSVTTNGLGTAGAGVDATDINTNPNVAASTPSLEDAVMQSRKKVRYL